MNLESSRRPGETRAAWRKRAMRQSADDASGGKLAQFVYEQLEVKGRRMRQIAGALGKQLSVLRQPRGE